LRAWRVCHDTLINVIKVWLRFSEEGSKLLPEISALDDADKFLVMLETISGATTLDEIRRACTAATAPAEPPKKSPRRKRK
jgi:hypothetical protein